MQKTNGTISFDDDIGHHEVSLLTYDEDEKQQNEINKETAKFVFTPEFIPFYPAIQKKHNLSQTETLLYGFIRFYLANGTGKFYFSNSQLAKILDVSSSTINIAVAKLSKENLIEKSTKIGAGGGTIRFIKKIRISENDYPECQKTDSPNIRKLIPNNNKINDNKNITSIATDKSVAENEQKNEINWKTTARPFSFSEKIKSMEQSTDRRMPIISAYWITKKMVFDNSEQYSTALRRELRPAGDLIGWELSKIKETIKWLDENADFKWTLETVLKYINENLENLENKKLPYEEQQRLLAEKKRAYYASLDRQ